MICWRTSHAEWIGIRKPLEFSRLERRNRCGLVEPDIFVELARERGLKIMTLQLRLGPVNHADGTLEPGLRQGADEAGRCWFSQRQQESRAAGIVAQPLITV